MADQEDKELESMKRVIESLESLEPEARTRVLEYVFRRLGIAWQSGTRDDKQKPTESTSIHEPTVLAPLPPHKDIRSLKEEKQPRSANQMAAVVAFYLSELAPTNERKDTIGTADLTKYFKQAGFKLPERPDATLANATNAGYFDSAGEGMYKLNPVGYNLVAHSLPSGERAKKTSTKRTAKSKKARAKKA